MNLIPQVYAQVNFANTDINPVAKFSSISKFVNIFIPLMTTVGGIAALIMLLYGAYMYLTSEGNPEKIKKSQATLMYAVIGLFLMTISYIITRIIGYVLKVDMPL